MSTSPRIDSVLGRLAERGRELSERSCPQALVDEARRIEIELAAALERVKRLEEALDQITKEVPAHDGYGGLFWPMFDGDGNEIGVQQVDPLMVIGSMHARALDAICGEEAKEPRL